MLFTRVSGHGHKWYCLPKVDLQQHLQPQVYPHHLWVRHQQVKGDQETYLRVPGPSTTHMANTLTGETCGHNTGGY